MNNDMSWIWNSPKLNQLAEANIKRFFAVLYKLLVEDKVKFDAIAVGGNSGLLMGRLAQLTFDKLGLTRPPLVKLPHQRIQKRHPETTVPERTNDVLVLSVGNQMYDYNLSKVKNLLFVDDEICKGSTALSCVESFIGAGVYSDSIKYYIVAEDQNFKASGYPDFVDINFHPFSKGVHGLYSIVTYIVPHDIKAALKDITGESSKKLLLILLGLPTRDKKIPQDNFDYLMNVRAELEIENLEDFRAQMRDIISDLIDKGIDEYKEGQIDLNDFSYIKPLITKD